MKILSFLLVFLFFIHIQSIYSSEIVDSSIVYGVSWRCDVCGGYNYSENADWQGYYYCSKCGSRREIE